VFTNIAFYKFVSILDPKNLQSQLLDFCLQLNLKGTIIVASEGINSCLVGKDEDIHQFIEYMQNDSRFSDIDFKKSVSNKIPFRKMLVKLKKEVIPMGFSYVKPAESTGTHLDALQFKKWLDDKEDIVILDTRNDYEVDVGTFRNAINPGINIFREFPNWIQKQLDDHQDWKSKKVVTFCTGGIRCEKATAYMQHIGFENVYQLNGGILKYLEETHQAASKEDNHFDGECFVFDYRVAVNHALDQTENYDVCYRCWNPLTNDDLKRSEYKQKVSCHHCINR